MPTLTELADTDVAVRSRLVDLSISNRELARDLRVNESSVRRWRTRNLSAPNSPETVPLRVERGVAQWVPGYEISGDSGEVRSVPQYARENPGPTVEADILREAGLDPGEWEVVTCRESRWQQSEGGEYLRAFKISVRRRSARSGDLPVEAMTAILEGYYRPRISIADVDRTFVVPVGDLQVGKIDGGGTEFLINRFAHMTDQVRQRLTEAGGARRLVLPWLGDCIEGIVSQNGRLATRLDVTVTEQVRIYRRLMLHQIAVLSPYAEHVIVPVVPGNHDEQTRQFSTNNSDSWAIEGASAVEDALTLSGKYENVSFVYPQDNRLTVTLEVGSPTRPFSLAFAHGHQARQPNNVIPWWTKQTFGRQPVGQADILMTGHFHHLRTEATGGGRTWLQIPALDGGSEWFRESNGADEPAGMVSLWVTPGHGIGWEGLVVHS